MSKQSARGAEWDAQRIRVLDRDGWACTYCGKDLVGDDATVDHIEALNGSGRTKYDDDELCSACRVCNGRKSDKTLIRLDYRSTDWF